MSGNIFTSKSKYNLGLTKEPSDQPVDLKAIYERVKAKKRDPKDDNSMREKCWNCGFDKWRFRYCEKLECEGHWYCRHCNNVWVNEK